MNEKRLKLVCCTNRALEALPQKLLFLIKNSINFNATQFTQYGCYLVSKITTDSPEQTMNEGVSLLKVTEMGPEGKKRKKSRKGRGNFQSQSSGASWYQGKELCTSE